jgi:hypothetical protein
MEKLAAEHPIPMYWVRPAQISSSTPGMHRFVWDLHSTAPKSLEFEFPISAIFRNTPLIPQGSWTLPGNYRIKLTVDGKDYVQALTVRMDPRIKSSLQDLEAQHKLQEGAVSGMNQSYDSLGQVLSVRAQIKELSSKATGKLAESLEALESQCAGLAGAATSTFFGTPPSGKQPENFSSLNQHFSQLLAIADSADAAPTLQAEQAYAELQKDLASLRAQWVDLRRGPLLDLNRELQNAGLPVIDPDKALSHELGEASDGDDEP